MLILSSPTAVAFNIGKFPVYYYGICIALAVLVGFVLSYIITKKYYKDINPDILYDVASVIIISGVICARLYYCILNYHYYFYNLAEILNFRQGGLAIHGGIIGGLVFGTLYCHIKKYPVLKVADIVAYGLIISQAVGRWGNFFNSEAYGLPSNHFIVVFIPESLRISGYESYKYYHPAFLYESVLNILVFLILFFVIRKLKCKIDGLIFASYLILYSFIRFFTEGLRLDCATNIGFLHLPQFVSLVIIVLSGLFIIYKLFKRKK